jgi:hypothetical protein
MRYLAAVLVTVLVVGCASIPPGTPRMTAQELSADPAKYDGQLVVVLGRVSYGFEDCFVDGIWYWPHNGNCLATEALFDAWDGTGYVVGVVSIHNHGYLGTDPFSLVDARPVKSR